MIFEWRSYVSEPGKAMAYLDLFRTFGVPLVTQHLPMLGYWLSDVGGLNVIHHLWAYENFEDRMTCRAGLASETAWQKDFIAPAFRTIRSQDSRFMTLVSGSAGFDALVAARRRTLAARPADEACFSPQWCVMTDHPPGTGPEGDEVFASFRTCIGPDLGHRRSLAVNVRVDDWIADANNSPAGASTLIRPLVLSPIGGTPEETR